MKIVSWNLRCPWADADGKNAVIHRAGFAYDKIRKEKPDVIAFQEIVPETYELLEKMLPEYEFFGSQRTADYSQEGLYVAWRRESFALMGAEVFWLSPTPYVAGSRFADQSDCSRVCIMTKLRDLKTNECYRFWDVHLDHVSDNARKLGLECLFDFVRFYSQKDATPHVILGDFNATPDSDTMAWCENQEGFVNASDEIAETFHNFGKISNYKIDYVYLSERLKEKVEKTEIWTDEHDGIYLSDHYPLVTTLK